MKQFFDKTRLSISGAAASFVIVMATVAPQASAQDARAEALERSLKQLEVSMQAIRSELNQLKSESARDTHKLMKIEEKSTSMEKRQAAEARKVTKIEEAAASGEKRPGGKSHMLFFRGGFAHSNEFRNGVSIQSGGLGGAGGQADRDAWYIGAGFDFNLTNDAWGLMPKTSVMSEVMFEYKEYGSKVRGNALPAPGAGVNVSQFTLTAAPKIKFLEGYRFRPWIIPAGLGIHVISPPSESITVLIPGVMFGAGADYRIWKDFFVGVDARYHLTSGRTDGIKIDGVTAGGYLGVGF
ncbi:MAG: porin family protein [Nitrosospira sp.]